MSLASSPNVQTSYTQPQQQQDPQLLQRPPRKCAEVCLELLFTEAVKLFQDKQCGPAAPAALQAVGFRVGRQLADRYVSTSRPFFLCEVNQWFRIIPAASVIAKSDHQQHVWSKLYTTREPHLVGSPPCTLVNIFRCRYSKDKPRFTDTLEVIKFICKDFWQAVFKKQVDNLKTNHRVSYPA